MLEKTAEPGEGWIFTDEGCDSEIRDHLPCCGVLGYSPPPSARGDYSRSQFLPGISARKAWTLSYVVKASKAFASGSEVL